MNKIIYIPLFRTSEINMNDKIKEIKYFLLFKISPSLLTNLYKIGITKSKDPENRESFIRTVL